MCAGDFGLLGFLLWVVRGSEAQRFRVYRFRVKGSKGFIGSKGFLGCTGLELKGLKGF